MLKLNFKKGYTLIAALVIIIICSVSVNIVQAVNGADPEPGSDGDPIVTKSYVDSSIQKYIQQLQQLQDKYDQAVADIKSLKEQVKQGGSKGFEVVSVDAGKNIYTGSGAEILLRSGKATAIKGESGGLSDTTSAKDLVNGMSVAANHLIISASDDGRGMHAVTKCIMMVRGSYSIEEGTKGTDSSKIDNDSTGDTFSNTGNTSNTDNTSNTGSTNSQEKSIGTATVNVKVLNVREKPDTGANLLTTAAKGEKLTLLSSSGGWYKVKTSDGVTGWVLGTYILVNQ